MKGESRDFAATVAAAQGEPAAAPASGPVVNVNCAGSGAADSEALPSFSQAADQYLTEETKPLFLVPLWVWLLVGAAGAAWWFWGRKHISIKW
jgi:hypothetical protein